MEKHELRGSYKKTRRVLAIEKRIKSKVKGGENIFSIDVKGGECKERRVFA
jgi:hypothetical protein